MFSQTRVQFSSNYEGDLDTLRIELEPAVKPIEFKRLPDKRFKDRGFLAPMVGRYTIGMAEFTIVLRPDGVLTMAGRTGAASDLLGVRGTKFEVKGQTGYTVEFLPDAAGRYTQLALSRGGSTNVAQRAP